MSDDDHDPCVLCSAQQALHIRSDGFDGVKQHCPRCGQFAIADSAISVLRSFRAPKQRALLSGWVREQNDAGVTPKITTYDLKHLLERSPPSLAERGSGLLKAASLGLDKLGQQFAIREPRFIAATYSTDFGDVRYLQRMLEEEGLLRSDQNGDSVTILPKGYARLDALQRSTSASKQGFIAMSFAPEMDEIHDVGIKPGILAAGYSPLRVDKHEHLNRIDDEIILQINASRFVVADFTGHKSGVYFEAG